MKQAGRKEENVNESQVDVAGRYILNHPLFMINKPRLMLYSKEGNVEGEIRWLGLKKMLKLDKHKEHHWVFQFRLDIVTIEMVINFITIDSFEGFMDTPIGHFRFTGKKVASS